MKGMLGILLLPLVFLGVFFAALWSFLCEIHDIGEAVYVKYLDDTKREKKK